MRLELFAKLFPVLVLSLGLAACSSGRTADTRRGVSNAATIPFRDVNLIRPEIPLLLRGLDYPYSTATLTGGCPDVAREIAALDAALGPESYQPGPDRNVWDRGGDFAEEQTVDAAEDTVSGLIPFRSWVRRISGASRAEREALRAFANGQQRRTFLRGYGASLGCPAVLPPPPPSEGGENRSNTRNR
jgi:hypothetical protein